MPITIRSTTGTYPGDPTGTYCDEEVTIDETTNTLRIEGTFSYNGTVYPLSQTFNLPAPSSTSPTYVSLQVSNTGTLQLLTSTTSMPTLQSGNVLILYSDIVPAGAPNDVDFTSDSEPVLD